MIYSPLGLVFSRGTFGYRGGERAQPGCHMWSHLSFFPRFPSLRAQLLSGRAQIGHQQRFSSPDTNWIKIWALTLQNIHLGAFERTNNTVARYNLFTCLSHCGCFCGVKLTGWKRYLKVALLKVSSCLKGRFPGRCCLLALAFFKVPCENLDGMRCCINKAELNWITRFKIAGMNLWMGVFVLVVKLHSVKGRTRWSRRLSSHGQKVCVGKHADD